MKIHETCECGAEFNVSSWADQNAWDAATYWRENHQCSFRTVANRHAQPTAKYHRDMMLRDHASDPKVADVLDRMSRRGKAAQPTTEES